MEKYCILIAVSFFFNTVYGAAVWETGAYTPSEWKPSSDNLLVKKGVELFDTELVLYKENGKAMQGATGLTDGSAPDVDGGTVDYTKVVGITSGSVAWKLNKPSNIYEVKVFSRWGDYGRDGIAVDSVQVSSDGVEWVTVSTEAASYGAGTTPGAGALFARLYDEEAFLAENAAYVKVNFSGSQESKGAGYVEVEACGEVSELPYATLSKMEIAEYTADFSVSVMSTGDMENADLYFAYGTDVSRLVPQRIAAGLNKGTTYPIRLRDLNHNTTYHYTAYIVTVTGARYDMSGSFTTVLDPCRYLPKDYIQVEYLQTSGKQCLNTEVKASATISAVMDFMPIERTGDAYLGAGDDDKKDWRLFFPLRSDYNTTFDIGNQRIGLTVGNDIFEKRRYTVSVGNAYLKVVDENGDAVTDLSLGEQVDGGVISETDIYLAAKGSNSEPAGYKGLSKLCIYSLVMKDGEEVVRDFVPCSNTVDKVYGLYDIQNKKFYQFVGTELESLTAGLEVPFIKKITEPGLTIILR
jgi:hypothetical protein